MHETMTVAEAAAEMNCTEQFIRVALQQERVPFGVAIKSSSNRWNYWIDRAKFRAWMERR